MVAVRTLLVLLAFAVAAGVPSQGTAQGSTSGKYSFFSVSVGWNTRVSGEAVDVVFDVETMPPGGLMSDAAAADIAQLCRTTAAERLSDHVRENKSDMPKFYSISLRTGGGIGMYARLYFRTNGDCTPVRLSQLE